MIDAGSSKNILLLADDAPTHAAVVLDHINAFRKSRHRVELFNPVGVGRHDLQLFRFDALIIHWSLVITWDSYVAPPLRAQIRDFEGLKVQFIQDEHRWVDSITSMMSQLGIDVLFSVLPPPAIDTIYSGRLEDVEIHTTLTGFVPDSLVDVPTQATFDRPVDIGYRGREIPPWMGRQTQEKVIIARGVLERAEQFGLRCDIAWQEDDRIYGEDWLRFLANCKASLGTPSGASIADFDGRVEAATRSYLEMHPNASFEELEQTLLAPFEGNVEIDVISPRIFEAAAMRTALILFPGWYSGLLDPNVHYLVLERDFSNLGEVAAALRDDALLEALTERAYTDLVASRAFSYDSFIRSFDEVIDRRAATIRRTTQPTLRERLRRLVTPSA